MQITCPACGFERDIDTSLIPASAATATCPKCKAKFKFRELMEDYGNTVPKGAVIPDMSIQNDTQPQSGGKEENDIEELEVSSSDMSQNLDENSAEYKEQAYAAYQQQVEQLEQLQKAGYTINLMTMVPWETDSLVKVNPFVKFFQTIVRVMFSSPMFFATMFRPFPISRAVIFYIIVGVIQFVARHLWLVNSIKTLGAVADPQLQGLLDQMTQGSTFALSLLVAPFTLILQLFLFVFILYAVVRLVQPQSADFSFITRIIAYAAAPGILSLVPVLGDFLAMFWFIGNIFVACRFGLRMSWGRAFLTGGSLCIFLFLMSYQMFASYLV